MRHCGQTHNTNLCQTDITSPFRLSHDQICTQQQSPRTEARRLLREIRRLKPHPQQIKSYPIATLKRLLQGFPDKNLLQWFLDTCQYGTRIPFDPELPIPERQFPTQPSWNWAEKVGVYSAFLKWHRTHCLHGPVPFTPGSTLSMIFAIPKPDGTFRGILNLSDRSTTGISINDCLKAEYRTVSYIQQCEIIERMRAIGPTGWLWVKDLEDGFHNLPVHPSDLHRLCIRLDGKIWRFQRLPMGLSASPRLFTDFMRFPLWAATHDTEIDASTLYYITIDSRTIDITKFLPSADLKQIGTSPFYLMSCVAAYVDDIFGLALREEDAWRQWHHSESVFSKMNLRCKIQKGRPPARVNILLGKQYDIERQWVRLDDEKFGKYITLFRYVMRLQFVNEHTLLSVIGKARHMATIYRPLHAFARGLESFIPYSNRTTKLGRGPAIRTSAIFRSRLQVLIDCSIIANKIGVPFSYFSRPKSNDFDFTVITDASMLVGAGGLASDGTFFQIRWNEVNLHIPTAAHRDIQWRELAAIYTALMNLEHRHADSLTDSFIHVFTDNDSCKWQLIKMSAPLSRPDLQILINEICIWCVKRRIHLWLDHVPGVHNTIADALSRFYPNPFSFAQHPSFDVGRPTRDCSRRCRDILQRAADLASDFLTEHSLIIHQRFQEYPEGFLTRGNDLMTDE